MARQGSRRTAVEFESEGAMLRGFLYEAVKGEPPFPIVVMTHGTSATIPMVTDRYAEVFAEAGVSALLYDHRNLGMSGGEPRQEINPWTRLVAGGKWSFCTTGWRLQSGCTGLITRSSQPAENGPQGPPAGLPLLLLVPSMRPADPKEWLATMAPGSLPSADRRTLLATKRPLT